MLRRMLVALATATAGIVVLAPASASATATAGSDPRTEDTRRVVVVTDGSDYLRTEGDCSASRDGTAATLECDEGGELAYAINVPRGAFNVRVGAVLEQTDGSGFTWPDGYRWSATRYRAVVAADADVTVRVLRVRVTYHVAARRDMRRCATAGELAMVDPAKGARRAGLYRTAAVLDAPGKRIWRQRWRDGFRYQTRSYPRCNGGRVRVGFVQFRGDDYWFVAGVGKSAAGPGVIVVTVSDAQRSRRPS